MTRPVVLRVEVQALGEPTSGHWCPACALPSGVGIAGIVTVNGSITGIAASTWCLDCGAEL